LNGKVAAREAARMFGAGINAPAGERAKFKMRQTEFPISVQKEKILNFEF